MPYISEHLSSLRQEIADLRDLNARLSEKSGHNAVDQTALELRTNRLREIKQELSKILQPPRRSQGLVGAIAKAAATGLSRQRESGRPTFRIFRNVGRLSGDMGFRDIRCGAS